jgi:hypothetical protein
VSLRRVAGDPLWTGGCPRLLLAAGQSLEANTAGLAGLALAWWRELTADRERLLGPAHPDTLAAGGHLADALLAAGQAAEAVTWSGWLLFSLASMLEPDHLAAIAAQVSMGRALTAAGQPGPALAALDEAAGRSERARSCPRARPRRASPGCAASMAMPGRPADRRCRLLEEEGLLHRVAGLGYYVTVREC